MLAHESAAAKSPASPPRQPTTPRRPLWRWLRIAVIAIVLVLLIPYALVPLYRVVDPVSTLMLWRRAKGARVERTVVPIERIDPNLPRAVVAAEDASFCTHHGIDLRQVREAVVKADGIGDARGGSTITQQLAKNLFLWQGRSFVRKGLELPLALWIDLVIPKRRQLEIYLNVVEWGPNGEFGAEAAARRAFGKPARQLTATGGGAARGDAAQSGPAQSPPARPRPAPAHRHLHGAGGLRKARYLHPPSAVTFFSFSLPVFGEGRVGSCFYAKSAAREERTPPRPSPKSGRESERRSPLAIRLRIHYKPGFRLQSDFGVRRRIKECEETIMAVPKKKTVAVETRHAAFRRRVEAADLCGRQGFR